MTRKLIPLAAVMVMVGLFGCATGQGRKTTTAQKAMQPSVAATYAGGEITLAELENSAAGSLLPVRQQLFEMQSNIVQDMVLERLVAGEAKLVGITPEEFMRREVDENLPMPGEEVIASVRKQLRRELPKDDKQARDMVISRIQEQERQSRIEGLRKRLLAKVGFQLLIDPPRVPLLIAPANPRRGPENAPVTLVEYSDFQCPYCKSMQQILRELDEKYPGKIRFVFKHYPVDVHPHARPAASASMCAAEQGQFWPYHDRLFDTKDELSKDGLISIAKGLNLDSERFTACFDAVRFGPVIEQDIADADKSGITGAPGYLINGRLVPGALPLDAFTTIIDDELRRADTQAESTKSGSPRSK